MIFIIRTNCRPFSFIIIRTDTWSYNTLSPPHFSLHKTILVVPSIMRVGGASTVFSSRHAVLLVNAGRQLSSVGAHGLAEASGRQGIVGRHVQLGAS